MAIGQQPLSRTLLQNLARSRLDEANALLEAKLWSGAYYLGGYAAELGLKACIAKRFEAETIPDLRLVKSLYTHSLVELVQIAQLGEELKRAKASPAFYAHWTAVSEWSEQSRYGFATQNEADALLRALGDDQE